MIWEMYYVRGGKCGHWLPRWPIRLMGEENGGVDVPMLAVGECFLTFGPTLRGSITGYLYIKFRLSVCVYVQQILNKIRLVQISK